MIYIARSPCHSKCQLVEALLIEIDEIKSYLRFDLIKIDLDDMMDILPIISNTTESFCSLNRAYNSLYIVDYIDLGIISTATYYFIICLL